MYGKLYIDFETRSAADLRKTGVYKYAKDASTDIICTGYAFDDEPVDVVFWKELPAKVREHVERGAKVIAHNAAFELVLWNTVCTRRYGWPVLSPTQVSCTMVRAYAMGLPGSLEKLAPALNLHTEKDAAGNRLMLKMCKPRANGQWHEEPEQLTRLAEYCATDVDLERMADKRLLSLTPFEQKMWVLDQKINWRGVAADVVSSGQATAVVELEAERLNAQIRQASGNAVACTTAATQIKTFVEAHGIKTGGVAKDDIVTLLDRDDLPSSVRRVLELRQEAAKSSTAKFKAFVDGACADGRLRGMFQYCGAAATGRWAGRRVQLHNLPRSSVSAQQYEEIFEALKLPAAQAQEQIDMFSGSAIGVLSTCLRGFLTAAPGHELMAMDFNSVEARVLAWLAGETRVLGIFTGHGLLYEVAAGDIFGVDFSHVNKSQRQIGKVSTLALGYQGGVGALQVMAKAYGVKFAPIAQDLWGKAPREHKERALWRWDQEQKKALLAGLSKAEWIASELTKLAWREANPNIVSYWKLAETAAMDAVSSPGVAFAIGAPGARVTYLMRGSFLFCKLPSGRLLCYPYPQIKQVETAWGQSRSAVTYKREVNRQWVREPAYGGLLVENITQAVSRDLLAEAIVRCEAAGYKVVMHVHDEVVSEIPEGFGSLEEMAAIMAQLPSWAQGLPIKAEGWRGKRYRK